MYKDRAFVSLQIVRTTPKHWYAWNRRFDFRIFRRRWCRRARRHDEDSIAMYMV